MDTTQTILATGADGGTGAVGRRIVDELVQRGHRAARPHLRRPGPAASGRVPRMSVCAM
ncbi:hypothetical protein [Streptomyces sp. MUM 178J]|uniref:hypothetical protein n=1 Tax=Streptomyces sp. MUM 178J TaxID=2791991 RepID=UPI001F033D31|nr:hypothetical protein [Streptomyces sp. MUM 178J]WRQ82272.1 hypothetical protein I3F59_024565 [Streptomyces sp. MUM 178J]